jgi:hypothetical protein
MAAGHHRKMMTARDISRIAGVAFNPMRQAVLGNPKYSARHGWGQGWGSVEN